MAQVNCKLAVPPLLNDVVLREIFSFLDVKSLKTCREVSRSWNTLSTYYLMQSTHIHINKIGDNPQTILKAFENDEISQNITSWSIEYHDDLSFEQARVLFPLIGHRIRRLELKPFSADSNNFYFLEDVLRNFCPNLVELDVVFLREELYTLKNPEQFSYFKTYLGEIESQLKPFEIKSGTLRTLRLKGVSSDLECRQSICLIRCCPELKRLEVEAINPFVPISGQNLRSVRSVLGLTSFQLPYYLSNYPEITRKLEHFTFHYELEDFRPKREYTLYSDAAMDSFNHQLEFSDKLKSLKLGSTCDQLLPIFLPVISNCHFIRTLEISGPAVDIGRSNQKEYLNLKPKIPLSPFSCLQKLTIFGTTLEIQHLLDEAENLRHCEIQRSLKNRNYANDKPPSVFQMTRPHVNLKTLKIHPGINVIPSSLADDFPNLEILHIGICSKVDSNFSFERAFQSLRALKRLKTLHVDYLGPYSMKDVLMCVNSTKNFPSLTELQFTPEVPCESLRSEEFCAEEFVRNQAATLQSLEQLKGSKCNVYLRNFECVHDSIPPQFLKASRN
jgi:hypothetical protein